MRWWLPLLAIAACSKSQPKVLATIDANVMSFAVDDAYVYAMAMDLGKASVVRVPRSGGTAETIVAKTNAARGLTVDGGKLYWGEIATRDQGSGSTRITPDEIQQHGGIAAAVSAEAQHFARIVVASSQGGATTELARFDGVPSDLAIDDGSIYVLSLGVWPLGAEIDVTQGSLVKLPKAGGPITVLVDHLNKPHGLAIDATSAYWTSTEGTWKIAKAGGKPERSTTSPTSSYTDGAFEMTLVSGKTRYRVVNKDSHATLTAESL